MSSISSLNKQNTADIKGRVDTYNALFKEEKSAEGEESMKEARKANYTTVVNAYYDIATDFYEYGWGTSFHFAPRHAKETLKESIIRHEHFLALKLKLKPGMKVLDVGCGVGGPLMEIARFSGAHVTGLNNNDYQISRGRRHVKQAQLEDICTFVKGDFMHIPFPNNSFDAVYAIEATCHAPDKFAIYNEIKRVLKPGGYFAAYEWVMTDKYDPQNAAHNKIKRDIEVGDGLPNLDITDDVDTALQRAAYEIVETVDLAPVTARNPIPWYQPLAPSFSLSGFRTTTVGKLTTHYLVKVLESMWVLPKGSLNSHTVLLAAADGLVKGGELQIFTPMYYFLVRKPEK